MQYLIFLFLSISAILYSHAQEKSSFVVSSYIRNSFYESGFVDSSKIRHSTDLILLNTSIYADGHLYFELPDNQAKTHKSRHLKKFKSRQGVINLQGEGAYIDAGNDLLISQGLEGVPAFTFGTWLYMTKWKEGAYLFRKSSNGREVSLRFSSCKSSSLIFHIKDEDQVYESLIALPPLLKRWHHISFQFDGSSDNGPKISCLLNMEKLPIKTPLQFPNSVPFIRSSFLIGEGVDGYLDDTFLNHTYLGTKDINDHRQGDIDLSNWGQTKTVAFWKYDLSSNIGKDERSWKNILSSLRNTIGDYEITVRLGLIHGEWKKAFKSNESVSIFVKELSKCIIENNLDGVDFDLEWCLNDQEWQNYSRVIIATRRQLGPSFIMSASLHPLYYHLSAESIDVLNFISLQAYGPSPQRFGYETFDKEIGMLLDYGIPRNKLIMGLPFYGVASDNRRPLVSRSYRDIVMQHPDLKPTQDTICIDIKRSPVPFTFNGKNTITEKTKLVKRKRLRGIMSWDLATDVEFDHHLSLFRTVVEYLNPDNKIK